MAGSVAVEEDRAAERAGSAARLNPSPRVLRIPTVHGAEARAFPVDLRRWLVALLLLGIAWRLGRWTLGMPLWRDEANLGLNILRRTFAGLIGPLDFFQVAPVLFLWMQKAIVLTLGAGDRAVRLLPTLASVAALLLFARLAVRSLPPVAAVVSVGFLASSYYATRYGSELKPYSVDLLASVLILDLTLGWLGRPHDHRRALLLLVTTPLLIGVSYPAVLAAGAAGLVLAGRALRERDRTFVVLAGLQLLVTLSAFALFFHLAGGQDHVTGPSMRVFWAPAFPPETFWGFLRWLLDIHTGNLAAYPVGGRHAGSTVTFLLMIAGMAALWRTRQRILLSLLLLPFGLNLVAAALHRYPYGDSARIAQHLAPLVCLLAGSGAAALLDRAIGPWRRRAPAIVLGLLCAIAAVGLAIDIVHPYKTRADRDVRLVVERAFVRQPDHRVLVLGEPTDVRYLWYLTIRGDAAVFNPPEIVLTGNSISALAFSPTDVRLLRVRELLDQRRADFVLREDAEVRLPLDSEDANPPYCRSLWWVRRD